MGAHSNASLSHTATWKGSGGHSMWGAGGSQEAEVTEGHLCHVAAQSWAQL